MVLTISERVRKWFIKEVLVVHLRSGTRYYADAHLRRKRRIGVYVYFQGTCGRSVHRGRAAIMP